MKLRIIIFLVFLFAGSVCSVSAQNKTLKQIEAQIKRLERELKSKESSEKSLLTKIENLNREIGLRKSLINKLKSELKSNRKQIADTEKKLSKTTEEYTRLKKIVRNRIISMYKRGRWSDWEIFLSFSSFNKALVWLKYQQRIAENDNRNLRLIREKSEIISRQTKKLNRDLARKKELLNKQEAEARKLEQKQQERKKLLAQTRKDKKLLIKRLAQKKASYKDILKRIKSEEAKRKTTSVTIASTGFGRKKGRLPWPVYGKVVSKYGRNLQPVLKTYIENIGIDIKGRPGSTVKAVNRGVVKWVTWQRGMENIVLLYHGEGFYTVYGHLETVLVSNGETVNAGDIIGTIGDSGNLEGPMLHFEVWKGEKHYNPELWLIKR
ncbi:hypothetical protein DRQ07_10525 [candidate division KSB1 bacterium]|nr:MAG: hypothetical protein DRQ07_10525 [candidate division KSB1 bacterium]